MCKKRILGNNVLKYSKYKDTTLGGTVLPKKLSIIVPVYNKTLYLAQCIQSIDELELNHSEIEAIFIDDASTDDSLSQLQQYEVTRDYMRVIALEENTGSPAQPRNVGIDAAEGSYVTFLDADDWLDAKGFPKLLEQAIANDADIAFGQALKHKDRSISKIARFASYQKAEDLVPYEIDKIFRAVGPPGKIIKKSVITDNNIQFEHMKYGEDKLFFTEVIALAQQAVMNDVTVYHVNRYDANQSLVTETDVFEKTDLNLKVLKAVLDLDIPETARKHVISRIVELDYLSRLFINRRFLNSAHQPHFYQAFETLVGVLKEKGHDITDYLTEEKYEKVCYCLLEGTSEQVNVLISSLVEGARAPHYVYNGQVYFDLPDNVQAYKPLAEPMYAVYGGTHCIDDTFYEVINVYKAPATQVNAVQLVKIRDESVVTETTFEINGNQLFVPSTALETDYDFDIQLIYDGYKPCKVQMTLPSAATAPPMHRQNFKTEFVFRDTKADKTKTKPVDTAKYYTEIPKLVYAIKKFKVYQDTEFKNEAARSIEVGELVSVSDIQYSHKGTPRLVLEDGNIITANKNFVTTTDETDSEQYFITCPSAVKVIKNCKGYEDRNFKSETGDAIKKCTTKSIEKIVFSAKGTPRLKTADGIYMTANRDFVQAID